MSETKPPMRTRSQTAAAAPAAVQPVATQAETVAAAGGTRIRSRAGRTPPPAVVAKNPDMAQGDGSTDWMKTGEQARAAHAAEALRQEQLQEQRAAGTLYMPRRFFLGKGEAREVVVLDVAPGPCLYEHNLHNPKTGHFDLFELCPRETQPCPLCEGAAGAKESYYVMFLTVVDLTPWTRKGRDGAADEEVAYSRRLLAVKFAQQQDYFRVFDELGTLRGVQLVLRRSNDNFAPGTGVIDVEASKENGAWIVHSEADIMASFGSPAFYSTPKEGEEPRLLKVENADTQCYQYGVLFKKPDAADLRARYGGVAPVGSRESNRATADGTAPW